MIRSFALAILSALLLWPSVALAQIEPRLTVELPEGDILVGQPVVLRLKLLVPTWMPKPPDWPNFEVPSLLVRLPERASSPISETIEGETWSGISRAYRLYPLEAGPFDLPAQKLSVTYADPNSSQPVKAMLSVDAIRFTATLPKGAKGLDTAIVAQGFSLTQQIEGGPDMQTGDAIQRIVTASIDGTTPILIPMLTPVLTPVLTPGSTTDSTAPTALRAYPKEPVVTETENRGVLSGTRTEATTYVAQADGTTTLPEITVQWFNLDSGKVETAQLDGMSLTITALPPPPPGPADYAKWGAALFGVLILIWLAGRLLWPRLRQAWQQVWARWVGSEIFAARKMRHALQSEPLGAIYAAFDHWLSFPPGLAPKQRAPMDAALAQLGATRFAQNGPGSETKARRTAQGAFADLRKSQRAATRRGRSAPGLATLNPVGQVSSGTNPAVPHD